MFRWCSTDVSELQWKSFVGASAVFDGGIRIQVKFVCWCFGGVRRRYQNSRVKIVCRCFGGVRRRYQNSRVKVCVDGIWIWRRYHISCDICWWFHSCSWNLYILPLAVDGKFNMHFMNLMQIDSMDTFGTSTSTLIPCSSQRRRLLCTMAHCINIIIVFQWTLKWKSTLFFCLFQIRNKNKSEFRNKRPGDADHKIYLVSPNSRA